MKQRLSLLLCSATLLLTAAVVAPVARPAPRPDEGMWLFENPPLQILKDRYGFTPDAKWLDHLRRSSVRFNSGGSGSFVSKDGLVMTNHHVALESIQKLSTEQRDMVKNGFQAESRDAELRAPDLELNALVSTEDVTARVLAADDPHAETQAIEAEENSKTGLRADVVRLYTGGMYVVYRYKQYTDVRLVWAPEMAVGFFGGDPDNFTYPRFNLDCSFFRVYENGEPVHPEHWLSWSKSGAAQGDLVFVSGNPGSTNRLDTVAQVLGYRDVIYPLVLEALAHRREALRAYADQGEEQARRAKDEMFGIENSLKALTGELGALRDETVIARKKAQEDEFLQTEAGEKVKDAFAAIDKARALQVKFWPSLFFAQLPGHLAELANQLFEYVAQPDANEAARKSAELALFSTAPVYPDLERVLITVALQDAVAHLGLEHPVVKVLLGGRTPEEQAAWLVENTKIGDVDVRKQIAAGGIAALAQAKDPMVSLLQSVQGELNKVRRQLAPVMREQTKQSERIAKARFEAFGKDIYPDATFTPRLAFGVVKGYPEGTRMVPYKTTLGGLYDRHDSFDGKEPYSLPARVLAARHDVDMSTPLNFVCTADIIGGNSGSPVVNRDNQVVGLIFDGNIQSLGGRWIYDETQGRAVAVHSAGIAEALRTIYKAERLVTELTGGS